MDSTKSQHEKTVNTAQLKHEKALQIAKSNAIDIYVKGLNLNKPNKKDQCLTLEWVLQNPSLLEKFRKEGPKTKFFTAVDSEFEPISMWFSTMLEREETCFVYNTKTVVETLKKIFKRGKRLNDYNRGTYLMTGQKDRDLFWKEFQEFFKKNEDFDYWVENDVNANQFQLLKVYLYKKKNDEERIYPVEIQIQYAKLNQLLASTGDHEI
ncbi:MAG: hypothetical protein ACQUHE_19055, partial [Bacteroidia bacterium]